MEHEDIEGDLADAEARILVATANIAYQRAMLVAMMQFGDPALVLEAKESLAASEQNMQRFIDIRDQIRVELAAAK